MAEVGSTSGQTRPSGELQPAGGETEEAQKSELKGRYQQKMSEQAKRTRTGDSQVETHPVIVQEAPMRGDKDFIQTAKGHERKTTGSWRGGRGSASEKQSSGASQMAESSSSLATTPHAAIAPMYESLPAESPAENQTEEGRHDPLSSAPTSPPNNCKVKVPHVYHDRSRVPDLVGFVRKKTGGVIEPFPEKLHDMLAKESGDGKTSVVGWLPHGRAFIVRKPKEFTRDIMPRYFRQTKLTSFQRQLNLYGFRRLTLGVDAGAYYHEMFLRGRRQLCMRMSRQKVKGTGHKQPSDAQTEPNFYAFPPQPNSEELEPSPDSPGLEGIKGAANLLADLATGILSGRTSSFLGPPASSSSARQGDEKPSTVLNKTPSMTPATPPSPAKSITMPIAEPTIQESHPTNSTSFKGEHNSGSSESRVSHGFSVSWETSPQAVDTTANTKEQTLVEDSKVIIPTSREKVGMNQETTRKTQSVVSTNASDMEEQNQTLETSLKAAMASSIRRAQQDRLPRPFYSGIRCVAYETTPETKDTT